MLNQKDCLIFCADYCMTMLNHWSKSASVNLCKIDWTFILINIPCPFCFVFWFKCQVEVWPSVYSWSRLCLTSEQSNSTPVPRRKTSKTSLHAVSKCDVASYVLEMKSCDKSPASQGSKTSLTWRNFCFTGPSRATPEKIQIKCEIPFWVHISAHRSAYWHATSSKWHSKHQSEFSYTAFRPQGQEIGLLSYFFGAYWHSISH